MGWLFLSLIIVVVSLELQMIIRFTAHVSDGKNANLEEVQSLGFLAASFHCTLVSMWCCSRGLEKPV
ncbi:Netrin receptor unc-5 [Clarias magur]|uniref:Netrin receptor unc-5 n=1 Tax=Clarias magur TaxID=1594786 RepID=A0A8J4XFT9_CLAMG|nr:Netrin receptor unc-5 [Clarias magur]